MITLKTHYLQSTLDKPFSLDIINNNYGLLNVQIDESKDNPVTPPLLFHFMLDISASMSDTVLGFRTKMELLHFIMENVLRHFAESYHHIHVEVNGFDDRIENYIDCTHVSKDNIEDLVSKIKFIRPRGSTNIGLALNSLNASLEKNYENIPLENRICIMLTDGEPTAGIRTTQDLVNIPRHDATYHYIALGDRHNGSLMNKLGHKTEYTSNWFVNELEHTGSVYGEILFNELNRLYKDVTITIEHGKIYDFIQGKFVTSLNLGYLQKEYNKDYHLEINDPDKCTIVLHGYDLVENKTQSYSCTTTICEINESNDTIYCLKHYFRLCVQNLMYNMRQESPPSMLEPVHLFRGAIQNNSLYEKYYYKITELSKSLKTFTNFNHLEDDPILLNLQKDLTVMKNVCGCIDNYKYIYACEDSHGKQRSYNTASQYEYDDLNYLERPVLGRETSAYATIGRVQLMREVTQGSQNVNDVHIVSPSEEDPTGVNDLV